MNAPQNTPQQSTVAAPKIAAASQNNVAQQVAGYVKQGMAFQQILDQFSQDQNMSPDAIAEIHEFKSRIQEAARIGTPVEQIIKSIWTDPTIQQDILDGIARARANNS